MELYMKELTHWEDAVNAYNVYKDCMYLPTEEKYRRKIEGFLRDDATKVFACLCGDEKKGMVVLSLFPQGCAELVGIAVEQSVRVQRIGTFMIQQVREMCSLQTVFAETDDDAVEFYRKNGFSVEKREETYDGQIVVRYQCKKETE